MQPGRPPTILFVFVAAFQTGVVMSQDTMPKPGDRLTDEQVARFAGLALKGMDTEYPNKPSNTLEDESWLKSPRKLHPAFYGCFDWHSSVHGHWMLVRLLKRYPESSVAAEIRERLNGHLTKENLEGEAAYFREKHNRLFERMYGWAWYFRLVEELHGWDDEDGKKWRASLKPLEDILVDRTMDYLPKLSFPIRTGVHPNTAFALGQALDYARKVKNTNLEELIVKRSRDYYARDTDYPFQYEPSGQDFFSAGLNEADLLRRVMSRDEYSQWLSDFVLVLNKNQDSFDKIIAPVDVSDVTDGKIVHLAGLDLSRAWCMKGIAGALSDNDVRRGILINSANAHAQKGFEYVFSGSYEGEHWLASFAIYLLTEVGN